MNLDVLNPQQRTAVQTTQGPVLILAGAGSGKTRALTYRVAYLLEKGVAPWNILAITFTNKAAKEMRERVIALAGERGEEVWVSTFHSMCARILRRDIEKLGYTRSFTIYDDEDQGKLLKEIYKQCNMDEKSLPPRELRAIISDAKNRLLSPDEWFEQSNRDFRSQQYHTLYDAYQTKLSKANALDFDDLLFKTLELFLNHPPVLESYRERFRYVHVDEYQDTNFAQYTLVKLLTQKSRNLCVVGDDDQSIYGWRGADIRNILDFRKDYPDAAVIKLEQNYRSTANILDAANQVIAHNEGRMEKSLWTEAGEGELIHFFQAADERDEAYWICSQAQKLVQSGSGWRDIAVLYRSNAQSRVLEESLVRAGIPYRIFGGMKFYECKEVKDILAYLRCAVNPADDISLKRIINEPKRSIGETTIAKLEDQARKNDVPLYSSLLTPPEDLSSRAKNSVTAFGELMCEFTLTYGDMSVSDFVSFLLEKTGLRAQYEKDTTDEGKARLENIDEFLGAIAEYETSAESPSLNDYLENVALVSDFDRSDSQAQAITLMTMHSAKGLEFPTVFVAGAEDGIFPSARSMTENAKMEEERRLCYVAITRARERLYFTCARERMLYNQFSYNPPSRFLSEIPPRLVEKATKKRDVPARAPASPMQHVAPKRQTPGAGWGAGHSALGIPGVQKGFTPSAAAKLAEGIENELFKPGDKVKHRKFGIGTVVSLNGAGSNARIIISFPSLGEKEFALSICPIVKVSE